MSKIRYNSIKVGAIQNNSGLFYGSNRQSKWNSTSRTSEGFGSIDGTSNTVKRKTSIVRHLDKSEHGFDS
ncbi:hypothetical protein [Terrihalobacillus insolitus]|uniref:hypothetical protein n=1 Tax=Terrihalobacillus insolitus TaxID=2950438 RepID=UPI00233FF5D3|nr:hypothetical protein [Terrihalobacillus insolitus]MDC3413716.1 hypothetical protein [Terrihalobacillus insolitus]